MKFDPFTELETDELDDAFELNDEPPSKPIPSRAHGASRLHTGGAAHQLSSHRPTYIRTNRRCGSSDRGSVGKANLMTKEVVYEKSVHR